MCWIYFHVYLDNVNWNQVVLFYQEDHEHRIDLTNVLHLKSNKTNKTKMYLQIDKSLSTIWFNDMLIRVNATQDM